LTTDVGFAESVIVGAAACTVTVAVFDTVPPGPVQANANRPVVARLPVISVPDSGLVPVHAPEAAHAVALVLLHVKVATPPAPSVEGAAENVRVGAGAAGASTAITRVFRTAPPRPLQLSVNELFAESPPELSEPLVARLPDQAPDAVQVVAAVVLQVKTEAAPTATDVGDAVKVSVGVEAGVGAGVDPLSPPPPQDASTKSKG
jgi:hypothetical protein